MVRSVSPRMRMRGKPMPMPRMRIRGKPMPKPTPRAADTIPRVRAGQTDTAPVVGEVRSVLMVVGSLGPSAQKKRITPCVPPISSAEKVAIRWFGAHGDGWDTPERMQRWTMPEPEVRRWAGRCCSRSQNSSPGNETAHQIPLQEIDDSAACQ